jgi:sialidase-1
MPVEESTVSRISFFDYLPALWLALAAPAAYAEPFLDKTDLFEAGKGGYTLYRIPGIVATKSGAILAYCEARKGTGSDWSTIDILLRRSTDGGKSWSAAQKIAQVEGPHRKNPAALAQKLVNADDVTYNNPVAIADRKTGAVHFLFCMEYMRCFYQRSDDDGRSFSRPVEITAALEAFRKDYDWQALATGPAHGIQLETGRLLVPVWLSRGTGGNAHRPSAVATIYSDDHGRTWQRGDIAATDSASLANPNETVAVELADGRVMLNMRNESKEHRRAVAISPDGATRWTAPAFDAQLKEPICMASICRYSKKPAAERNRLLFANPDNLERAVGKAVPGQNRDRKNLTVRLSEDEGKTWPVARSLEPGFSGYSDLAVGPDGTIYCLYERGSTDGNYHYMTRSLTVARFNIEWLTLGKE